MKPKQVLAIIFSVACLGLLAWLRVGRIMEIVIPSQDLVQGDGETIGVAADDPEMLQAFERARGTLPIFWKRMQDPGDDEDGFSVKVPVRDNNGVEYFWLEQVSHADGRVRGAIGNKPEHVQSVTFGQYVEMPESLIVDWMYIRGDVIVGNYTARVLLKRMAPAEAKKVEAHFVDP